MITNEYPVFEKQDIILEVIRENEGIYLDYAEQIGMQRDIAERLVDYEIEKIQENNALGLYYMIYTVLNKLNIPKTDLRFFTAFSTPVRIILGIDSETSVLDIPAAIHSISSEIIIYNDEFIKEYKENINVLAEGMFIVYIDNNKYDDLVKAFFEMLKTAKNYENFNSIDSEFEELLVNDNEFSEGLFELYEYEKRWIVGSAGIMLIDENELDDDEVDVE